MLEWQKKMADLNRRYQEVLEREKELNERQEQLNSQQDQTRTGSHACIVQEIPWQAEEGNAETEKTKVEEITENFEQMTIKVGGSPKETQ